LEDPGVGRRIILKWIFKNRLNKAVRVIKSRKMRWAGHVTRMGDSRYAYRVLVERSEEKRPVGRPRCR
jgi:hypothetical protein